jgi:SET family sugar efflux transporter-like MFS transporter
MLSLAGLIWRDPSLRTVAAGILLFGTFAASIGIHQSLIAIDGFGLSDGEYAILLALAMAVSVSSSIGVGIVTDRGPYRRLMATMAAAALVAGPSLVWLTGLPLAFVVAHVLFIPLGGTIFGQLFAVARLASAPHPPPVRDGLLAVLRAHFAVPFVLVLPVWGFALSEDVSLLTIYPVVAVAGALLLLLTRTSWPADDRAPWVERKSGLGLRAALSELVAPSIMLRVALMGAVHAGGAIAGIVLGLLFARAGRSVGDVGLFFGLFVAVEIAGTLAVGALVRRLPRLGLVAAGTAIYATFLGLLPFLAPTPWVWVLTLPAGIGGALIYTLAIAYLQDLLAARPGAGASLIALQRVSAEGLTTAVFAVGAFVQGYATVSVMGGLLAIAAMAVILRLDGVRHPSEEAGPGLGEEAAGHVAAERGALLDRDGRVVREDAAAVGAQDLAAQAQAAPLDLGEARDGRLAGAVEGLEEGALGREALAREGVVDKR